MACEEIVGTLLGGVSGILIRRKDSAFGNSGFIPTAKKFLCVFSLGVVFFACDEWVPRFFFQFLLRKSTIMSKWRTVVHGIILLGEWV